MATTLLDSSRYSDTDVFELYARRWEIEVRFRDVKTTMGLEFLAVRSPEMARKGLWMLVIAHNLIRAVMQEAARTTESDLGRMSFKATLDLVIASLSRISVLIEIDNRAIRPLPREVHSNRATDPTVAPVISAFLPPSFPLPR